MLNMSLKGCIGGWGSRLVGWSCSGLSHSTINHTNSSFKLDERFNLKVSESIGSGVYLEDDEVMQELCLKGTN